MAQEFAGHFVVVPLPIHGHINPLLQLSVHLVSKGIRVTFITSSNTHDKVVSSLCSMTLDDSRLAAIRKNLSFRTLQADEHWKKKLACDSGGDIWKPFFFMASKVDEFQQLVEEVSPVSCIILDLLVSIFDPVGRRLDIPSYTFWTASAAFLLLSFHLRSLVEIGYVPLTTLDGKHLTKDVSLSTLDSSIIPGIPKLCVHEDVPYNFLDEDIIDPGHKNIMRTREVLLQSRVVILNTYMELEDDELHALEDCGLKIFAVGPLLDPYKPENNILSPDDESLTWLATQVPGSVIYISFGTVANISAQRVQEVARGLEECGHPFLWILRKEHRLLLPDLFLQRMENRGKVVSWCPQVQVLRHSSTAAFLTHCGWNSVMESLTSGVPMLCLPLMADQSLNCKYVVDIWGCGMRLGGRDSVLEGKDVAAALNSVVGDQRLRENVGMWRCSAVRAIDSSGGSSSRSIRRMVEYLTDDNGSENIQVLHSPKDTLETHHMG